MSVIALTPAQEVEAAGLAVDDRKANGLLAQGVAVAALGAAGAALGAVCPLCVVVAPALLAGGAFKKARVWRARQKHEQT